MGAIPYFTCLQKYIASAQVFLHTHRLQDVCVPEPAIEILLVANHLGSCKFSSQRCATCNAMPSAAVIHSLTLQNIALIPDALPALAFRLPWRWRLATCPPLHATTLKLDHPVSDVSYALHLPGPSSAQSNSLSREPADIHEVIHSPRLRLCRPLSVMTDSFTSEYLISAHMVRPNQLRFNMHRWHVAAIAQNLMSHAWQQCIA